MWIRLGTYSIKIKSYSANELGLDTLSNDLVFNVYQKIFHFWYIPIFPAEKNAIIKKKASGNIFLDSTPEMRTALNLKLLKTKSPLWSYIGVIILCIPLLIILGYMVYNLFNMSSNQIGKALRKNERISDKEEFVESPQLEDVYTFKLLQVDAVTDMNGHIAKYTPNLFIGAEKVNYFVDYISKDSIGFKLSGSDYLYDPRNVMRLSKKELTKAIDGYQDLDIHTDEHYKTKDAKIVSGVYKIIRDSSENESSSN